MSEMFPNPLYHFLRYNSQKLGIRFTEGDGYLLLEHVGEIIPLSVFAGSTKVESHLRVDDDYCGRRVTTVVELEDGFSCPSFDIVPSRHTPLSSCHFTQRAYFPSGDKLTLHLYLNVNAVLVKKGDGLHYSAIRTNGDVIEVISLPDKDVKLLHSNAEDLFSKVDGWIDLIRKAQNEYFSAVSDIGSRFEAVMPKFFGGAKTDDAEAIVGLWKKYCAAEMKLNNHSGVVPHYPPARWIKAASEEAKKILEYRKPKPKSTTRSSPAKMIEEGSAKEVSAPCAEVVVGKKSVEHINPPVFVQAQEHMEKGEKFLKEWRDGQMSIQHKIVARETLINEGLLLSFRLQIYDCAFEGPDEKRKLIKEAGGLNQKLSEVNLPCVDDAFMDACMKNDLEGLQILHEHFPDRITEELVFSVLETVAESNFFSVLKRHVKDDGHKIKKAFRTEYGLGIEVLNLYKNKDKRKSLQDVRGVLDFLFEKSDRYRVFVGNVAAYSVFTADGSIGLLPVLILSGDFDLFKMFLEHGAKTSQGLYVSDQIQDDLLYFACKQKDREKFLHELLFRTTTLPVMGRCIVESRDIIRSRKANDFMTSSGNRAITASASVCKLSGLLQGGMSSQAFFLCDIAYTNVSILLEDLCRRYDVKDVVPGCVEALFEMFIKERPCCFRARVERSCSYGVDVKLVPSPEELEVETGGLCLVFYPTKSAQFLKDSGMDDLIEEYMNVYLRAGNMLSHVNRLLTDEPQKRKKELVSTVNEFLKSIPAKMKTDREKARQLSYMALLLQLLLGVEDRKDAERMVSACYYAANNEAKITSDTRGSLSQIVSVLKDKVGGDKCKIALNYFSESKPALPEHMLSNRFAASKQDGGASTSSCCSEPPPSLVFSGASSSSYCGKGLNGGATSDVSPAATAQAPPSA